MLLEIVAFSAIFIHFCAASPVFQRVNNKSPGGNINALKSNILVEEETYDHQLEFYENPLSGRTTTVSPTLILKCIDTRFGPYVPCPSCGPTLIDAIRNSVRFQINTCQSNLRIENFGDGVDQSSNRSPIVSLPSTANQTCDIKVRKVFCKRLFDENENPNCRMCYLSVLSLSTDQVKECFCKKYHHSVTATNSEEQNLLQECIESIKIPLWAQPIGVDCI